MFPTKTDSAKRGHTSFIHLADVAFQLWRRKDAGYPQTKQEMMPVEFEALLMMNDLIGYEERKLKVDLIPVLMAGMNLKKE